MPRPEDYTTQIQRAMAAGAGSMTVLTTYSPICCLISGPTLVEER